MVSGVFRSEAIEFAYPPGWAVEVASDGTRSSIWLNEPEGVAFALFVLDTERPEPTAVAQEALDALRSEYKGVDADPVREEIGGTSAEGFDVEFISLDLLVEGAIRSFRTPRQTVTIVAQWRDDDNEARRYRAVFAAVRKSVVEPAGSAFGRQIEGVGEGPVE